MLLAQRPELHTFLTVPDDLTLPCFGAATEGFTESDCEFLAYEIGIHVEPWCPPEEVNQKVITEWFHPIPSEESMRGVGKGEGSGRGGEEEVVEGRGEEGLSQDSIEGVHSPPLPDVWLRLGGAPPSGNWRAATAYSWGWSKWCSKCTKRTHCTCLNGPWGASPWFKMGGDLGR